MHYLVARTGRLGCRPVVLRREMVTSFRPGSDAGRMCKETASHVSADETPKNARSCMEPPEMVRRRTEMGVMGDGDDVSGMSEVLLRRRPSGA
jgi:hypothetical protein